MRPAALLACVLVAIAAHQAATPSAASAQSVGSRLSAGSCDRPSDIAPLSRQILATHLCRYPRDLESLRGIRGITTSSYYALVMHPYATPALARALRSASDAGATITLNAAYRTVLQQYVMRRRAPLAGSGCFGTLAAPPGGTHAAGCALDVQGASSEARALEAVGFTYWGTRDPVHFSLDGCMGADGTASTVSHNDVRAFQYVWNANHPSDRLRVTGNFDAATEDRLKRSPIAGFPMDGCPVDADADGTFVPDDCDDHNAAVHPGARETCSNGVDDDCAGGDAACDDAFVTVDAAQSDAREPNLEDARTEGFADAGTATRVQGQCGCRAGTPTSPAYALLLFGIASWATRRRRARDTRG